MQDHFTLKTVHSVKTRKPILIQGLPGIGNVGKIAVEFMIENLDAKKIYDITSSQFPGAVFINEQELVELPKISVYYKKLKNNELLFLNGDVQPQNETACYTLSEKIIELSRKHHVQEIVSLGGMGLETIPETPRVYFAGTTQDILKRYKATHARSVYVAVGPIMGMAGMLVGIAKENNIPGVIILAETLAHPAYLGVKGARELIHALNMKLNLKINISELDKEIKVLERTMKEKMARAQQLAAPKQETSVKGDHASYIG